MNPRARKSFKTIRDYAFPVLTPDDLARLHLLSLQFNIDALCFTPGSLLAVSGLDDESFQKFCQAIIPHMQQLPANGTIIHSCNGNRQCDHEFADTGGIISQLSELRIEQPLPGTLKIGVAGCWRCCSMVRVRDIGIFPGARNSSTWDLSFGGNGGYTPRIGDIIARQLAENELIETISTAIDIYRQHARRGERTARFIVRYGVDKFVAEIKKSAS